MKIILETRCGCRRWSEFPEPLPPRIHVPLRRSISFYMDERVAFDSHPNDIRIFEKAGKDPTYGAPRYLEAVHQ